LDQEARSGNQAGLQNDDRLCLQHPELFEVLPIVGKAIVVEDLKELLNHEHLSLDELDLGFVILDQRVQRNQLPLGLRNLLELVQSNLVQLLYALDVSVANLRDFGKNGLDHIAGLLGQSRLDCEGVDLKESGALLVGHQTTDFALRSLVFQELVFNVLDVQ